jgi:hypothetical protein
MPKAIARESAARSTVVFKTALGRERRKSKRMRELFDTLQGEIKRHRHELDLQVVRLGQLQAQVDRLKAK